MAKLDIQRLRPAQMDAELYARWQACADKHPLQTAFIQPEFVSWCAQFRTAIEVLCISQADKLAFLPVVIEQSSARDFIADLTDYNGLLYEKGFTADSRQLLQQAGLKSLYLNSAIAVPEGALVRARNTSPYIDMGPAPDYWLEQLKRRKSSRLTTSLRYARKAGRDFGDLRLEFYSDSKDAFQKLREWKGAQRKQTGTRDIFSEEWAVRLLQSLPAYRGDSFSGALSCLYAGKELMAVHLGMHSQHTLHWWLTTYNPELRKYSPGANLLIELARAAQARGLSRVDLGYGEEDYKNSFKNGEISTYSLVLDASALRAGFRRLAEQGKSAIKNTALEQQARKAQKLIRRR